MATALPQFVWDGGNNFFFSNQGRFVRNGFINFFEGNDTLWIGTYRDPVNETALSVRNGAIFAGDDNDRFRLFAEQVRQNQSVRGLDITDGLLDTGNGNDTIDGYAFGNTTRSGFNRGVFIRSDTRRSDLSTGYGRDIIKGTVYGGANSNRNTAGILDSGTISMGEGDDLAVGKAESLGNGTAVGFWLLKQDNEDVKFSAGSGDDRVIGRVFRINGGGGGDNYGIYVGSNNNNGIVSFETGDGHDYVKGTADGVGNGDSYGIYVVADKRLNGSSIRNVKVEFNTGSGDDTVFGKVKNGEGLGKEYGIYVGSNKNNTLNTELSFETGDGNDHLTGIANFGSGVYNEGLINTGSGHDIVTGKGSDRTNDFSGNGVIDLESGDDIIEGFGQHTFKGGVGFDRAVLLDFVRSDFIVSNPNPSLGVISLTTRIGGITANYENFEAFNFSNGEYVPDPMGGLMPA